MEIKMKRFLFSFFILCGLVSCATDEYYVPYTYTQELNAQVWVKENGDSILREYDLVENGKEYISNSFIIENPSPTGYLKYEISFDHNMVTLDPEANLSDSIDPYTSKEFTISSYGCSYRLSSVCITEYQSVEVTVKFGPTLDFKKTFILRKN
jgi:hypothetical protein